MRQPRVYNKHHGDAPEDAVYIGRGSPYGNPFRIGDWWPARKRSMTRDDVCSRFEFEVLPKIDVSDLRGKDLVCFCTPLRCHGQPILRKANQ